jgi:hypothetical protein
MAALIESLARLDDDERIFMRELSELTLRNWNGIEVGRLRAAEALRGVRA